MIKLVLEMEALSANDPIYGINKQGSRHRYKKTRSDLEARITSTLGLGSTQGRVAFKFTRLWGPRKRAFDEANLIGGFKILVDALVKTGHIKDDCPDLFKGYYKQEKSNGDGCIIIEQLTPHQELEASIEAMAEIMLIDEATLLRVAKDKQLTKG